MTLSDVASIGSLISGLAVLISLVYLSLQVRQSERNQRASIRQGRTTRVIDLNVALLEPSVAVAMSKGHSGAEDISETQLQQFRFWYRATFYMAEDTFYQHKDRLLNESAFGTSLAGWKIVLTSPGVRVMWKGLRSGFDGEFVEFMDKLLAETPVRLPIDALAQWKSDIAAENALAAH